MGAYVFAREHWQALTLATANISRLALQHGTALAAGTDSDGGTHLAIWRSQDLKHWQKTYSPRSFCWHQQNDAADYSRNYSRPSLRSAPRVAHGGAHRWLRDLVLVPTRG
jgi:hypothetical protein